MNSSERLGRSSAAGATLAVVGLLGALLVSAAWIGGELHYRNCLSGAELRYPTAYRTYQEEAPPPSAQSIGGTHASPLPRAHFVFHARDERSAAIAGCSRWPL